MFSHGNEILFTKCYKGETEKSERKCNAKSLKNRINLRTEIKLSYWQIGDSACVVAI